MAAFLPWLNNWNPSDIVKAALIGGGMALFASVLAFVGVVLQIKIPDASFACSWITLTIPRASPENLKLEERCTWMLQRPSQK